MIAHTTMFRPTPEANLQRPAALGNVYYVDNGHTNTSDDNEGTDPNHPLTKVQAGIDKCTDSQGDYVFVLDCYDADLTTISVDKVTCHLVGMSLPTSVQWTALWGKNTHDVMNIAAAYIEVAGFSFTSVGFDGIHWTSSDSGYDWVHHCSFAAGAASLENGIEFDSVHGNNSLIEDCFFGGEDDQITGYGIYGGAHMCTIRNNILKECDAGNIHLTGIIQNGNIHNNLMTVLDDANGRAIYLNANVSHFMVVNNIAVDGMLSSGYTYNPYKDLAANTENHWGMNYRGNAVVEPVGI